MRRILIYIGLLLAALLAASSCGSADPDSAKIEAVVRDYYKAVAVDDAEAQASFWVSSRKAEGLRQAQVWSKRKKDGLQISDYHLEDMVRGDDPRVRLVHYSVLTKDRPQPDGKAAFLENVDGTWRFRELR